MFIHTDGIKDKVEFFEADSLKGLEERIQRKIEDNQAILLRVNSVSHQVTVGESGKPFYTAVVHFRSSN
ncbi:DUF2536 family protein [Alteribacter populi]|uniref:DUF2536 family protein n=1 Tax=Alteribacter populi TaxID=2011011 RepID=UPI000BBAD5D7|nr:DUF2536 family protein [Alteribacter populi]